jgi:hypothetical protein
VRSAVLSAKPIHASIAVEATLEILATAASLLGTDLAYRWYGPVAVGRARSRLEIELGSARVHRIRVRCPV